MPRHHRPSFLAPPLPPSPFPGSRPPARAPRRPPVATSTPLPLNPKAPSPSVSYARLVTHCASALAAVVAAAEAAPAPAADPPDRSLRLTLDFPPQPSETSAGTLVSRFENNLNFIDKLLAALSVDPAAAAPLGGPVEIRDNVNPQGGGEYLSDDEVMLGLRAPPVPALQHRPLTLLINAGVDPATLRHVQPLDDDPRAVLVLLNCGLHRVSWFARRRLAPYIDSFHTAYYLNNVAGAGWLLKNGVAPWQVFVNAPTGVTLLHETEDRPKLVDVEAKVRLAAARISTAPG